MRIVYTVGRMVLGAMVGGSAVFLLVVAAHCVGRRRR